MYRWRELFVMKILAFLYVGLIFLVGIVDAPKNIAMVLSEGIYILTSRDGIMCLCMLPATGLATVVLISSFIRIFDWRPDFIINAEGIRENINIFGMRRVFIPWDAIKHIHIYPRGIPQGLHHFTKNPIKVVIVLNSESMIPKKYPKMVQWLFRSSVKMHRHVENENPESIISIYISRLGFNGLDAVRTMRKYAKVSTHGQYRNG